MHESENEMDIKSSPSGKVLTHQNGYTFFVPNALPPKFEWTNKLITHLSKADHLLGMLSQEGLHFPEPQLFIRPLITKEAVLSSKIEGTQTTFKEMLAYEAGLHVERNPSDLQEVHNYIVALDFGLKRLKDLPLSLRLIKEIHEKIMSGTKGAHVTPGEFRRSQNWIGRPGSTITTAKYIPPAPEISTSRYVILSR